MCGILFVLYFCLQPTQIDTTSVSVWNSFFWVLVLFSSVQITAHRSSEQKRGDALFYYLMASSAQLMIARVVYHFLVLLAFSILIVGGYFLLMGNPLKQPLFFLLTLLSYWVNAAILLSMVGVMGAKLTAASTLHAAVGLPMLLPSLLLYLPIGQATIYGMTPQEQGTAFLAILSLNALYIALGVLLFPYLWED